MFFHALTVAGSRQLAKSNVKDIISASKIDVNKIRQNADSRPQRLAT